MLIYRILSALVMIPAVIAALFLLSPEMFALAIGIICILGAWEWAQFAGITHQAGRIIIALFYGAILYLLYIQASQAPSLIISEVVRISLLLSLGWWIAAIGLVISYPHSAIIWHERLFIRLLFGLLTIVPFFFGLLALQAFGAQQGPYMAGWWMLYVMLLVWGADTGAYTFGRLFGKHKLAPKVSPGKTWEGAIGGVLTAALIAILFSYFVKLPVLLPILLLCSVIAVIASIFGDLSESMFKRQAGIKDSSQLIPGHGGIMDRIDSLTAAIPVFTGIMLLVFIL